VNRRQIVGWAPLGLAVALGAVLSFGLARPEGHSLSSQIIGAEVPALALPAASASRPGLSDAALRDGRPHLVNFFASWCVPCRAEAPALGRLAAAGMPIVGVAVRDTGPALDAFLTANGNPYQAIGSDPESRAALAFGTSGVPETFLVDGRGRIRTQVIGPIGPDQAGALLAVAR
jgi:cytochrome c biogenesis protein CcmG/thiol:disulfide interchange protein DsbE